VVFIYFLLRQRTQLVKLQNQLKVESNEPQSQVQGQSKPQIVSDSELNKRIDMSKALNRDEFAENLQITKDLQSKMDGLAVELRIRGEMIVERDNHIGELQKKIYDLEAQVSIFKEQIAPALEQTITKLRSQVLDLQSASDQQTTELQAKDDRISASQKILQEANMGQLLDLEEYQIRLSKKEQELKTMEDRIIQLQGQVDQLPVICLNMTNEIKKRESEIHTLKVYNSVLNKKLISLQNSMQNQMEKPEGAIQELSKKLIELGDQLQEEKNRTSLLDREILMLHNIILEKESKIMNLEQRLRPILKLK
jgi:chromosome segregation ATPase